MQILRSIILGLTVSGLMSFSAHAEQITAVPAQQLDWKITGEGVAFAALKGDRFVEPYMAMVRLPAGLVSPPHTKSANMFGVVISGTMQHMPVGADPAKATLLSTGSYYKVPAGLPHISSCVSQKECVTFLYQDGNFDFLPVVEKTK